MTPWLSFFSKNDTLVVMGDLFWLDTGTSAGTGRPLVLLHGGFLDHGLWDYQIPALASRHRVIAPDARGHGRSANATEPYRLADDVAGLLRRLDTGPAILVGVSMGGSTAIDTALEHPDLVSAVVISGNGTSEPYFTDPWTTRTMGTWHDAMAAGDLDAAVDAFMLLGSGPHRALDDLDPEVVSRLYRMARSTMSKHSADEPNHLVQVSRTWERLGKVGVPVLAINGALDSPDHIGMAERLTGSVPNGRALSIDGAAHYPNLEHPETFNDLLETFIATL
jgi:pimeloyl-ACP methyl ester carboxylesterase